MFGFQLGQCVYSLFTMFQRGFRWMDIVYYKLTKNELIILSLIWWDVERIKLHKLPSRYRLEGSKFLRGTPFKLHKGSVKLMKKVRKGMGFTSIFITETDRWPIESSKINL